MIFFSLLALILYFRSPSFDSGTLSRRYGGNTAVPSIPIGAASVRPVQYSSSGSYDTSKYSSSYDSSTIGRRSSGKPPLPYYSNFCKFHSMFGSVSVFFPFRTFSGNFFMQHRLNICRRRTVPTCGRPTIGMIGRSAATVTPAANRTGLLLATLAEWKTTIVDWRRPVRSTIWRENLKPYHLSTIVTVTRGARHGTETVATIILTRPATASDRIPSTVRCPVAPAADVRYCSMKVGIV